MLDPTGWGLRDFADAYRSGISVTAVIEATLDLLRRAPIGVLIGPPLDRLALADAARLADIDPSSLPLYGVPFVAKDNIDVAGVPTTAGCPGYAYTPSAYATVVAQLRAAGAIVVGKANLDQFATGLVGTRTPYGVPPNVLDPALVPGGSSSGSAVAVGLGLVPFSLGTDTAGSGRVPAALNGIVGIKPTLGSCSTRGIVPAVRRLDCPSVFARDVADAAAVAALLRHDDPDDDSTRRVPRRTVFRAEPVIGVPRRWPPGTELNPVTAESFDRSVEQLAALGCRIEHVDIERLVEIGALLYSSSLVAERTTAVGAAVDTGVEGLDVAVGAIIGRGNSMSATDAYATEYDLARFRAVAAPMWDAIDVLALPTTTGPASLDEVSADPFGPNERLGRLTTFVNLLDLAAVVVPMGDGRIPCGLQLIGRAWSDLELERLASGFETGHLATAVQPATVVVVGAHLLGLPLNHQLTERRATLVGPARTSADYRLYALDGTVPAKPGMVRVEPGTGVEIEVEIWSMGIEEFGSFVAAIPPPLSIGTITLADGTAHKGFLCEPIALTGAADISDFGGWRAYLASRS
ncbi:MAG: urea amidolyase [Acidimicrobiales bacterium]|nr:urea amidolyase [Acidimicrobiales bacterium]